jgi:PBSX family phage terminase large subunit
LREITRFSPKQRNVLNWWAPGGANAARDAIICDGAVRSGKTLCMSLSFAAWAMFCFEDTSFAICGKTIASLRRNIVTPILPMLTELGFCCEEKISRNLAEISVGTRRNRFYFFGGKDESSAALIQGMTLGGVLLDEVALMPRSFVEQALARCSLEGSKLWFNCNPEYPAHWFHTEWVEKAEEKNALYLHFTMEDNPGLSRAVLDRYKKLYSGAFYARFVKGQWVSAEGLVYPMFSREAHVVRDLPARFDRCVISCDYGTVNPSSFGLWGHSGGCWYRLREYYWDSRARGAQRTDEEHYRALELLAEGRAIERVLCDPSAASFLECVRRHGAFSVVPAKNDVLLGIRKVADALRQGLLKIHESCGDCIRDFESYIWETGGGRDAPRKEHDHAMDDVRYFVTWALQETDGDFFAASVARR